MAEYVVAFAESFMAYYFTAKLLKDSELEKRELRWYLICSALIAIMLTGNRTLTILSNSFFFAECLCLAVTIMRISQIGLRSAFVMAGLYNIAEGIIDMWLIILICILLRQPNLGKEMAHHYSFMRLLILAGSRLLLCLIFSFICRVKKDGRLKVDGPLGIVLFVLGFAEMVYFQNVLLGNMTELFVQSSVANLTFLLLVCTGAGLYLLYKNTQDKIDFMRMKNDMLEQKLKELKAAYRENNIFYHDMKNHLNVIYQFLRDKEYEKTETYIKSVQPVVEKRKMRDWTKNTVMDVILCSKIMEMEKKDITYEIDTDMIGAVSVSERDLCVILGNLLDNAIEACEKLEKEQRKIRIKIVRKSDMLDLVIENTCIPRKSDVWFLTTKSDKRRHGYGIASVERAVEKSGGYFNYEYRDGMFYVAVILMI